jgi:hypothetical protein
MASKKKISISYKVGNETIEKWNVDGNELKRRVWSQVKDQVLTCFHHISMERDHTEPVAKQQTIGKQSRTHDTIGTW